jgi:hypothetical protein
MKINSDNADLTIKAPYKYYLLNQEAFDKEFGNDVSVKRLRAEREYLVNYMDELVVVNNEGQRIMGGNIAPINQAVRGEVEIVFSPNGNSEWKKQQSASVTLMYTDTTIIESAIYGWSKSASQPFDTGDYVGGGTLSTSGTSDGSGKILVRTNGIITPPNLTGNGWYLWVKVEYKDDGQNRVKYQNSGSFFLDNTAPTFDLDVS